MIFQGKCIFSDGSQYEGDWKRGLIHGDGNKKNKKKSFSFKLCCFFLIINYFKTFYIWFLFKKGEYFFPNGATYIG